MFLSWWRKKAKRKPNAVLRLPTLRPTVEWLEDRRLLSAVPGKDTILDLGDTQVPDSQSVADYLSASDPGGLGDGSLRVVASSSTGSASKRDGGAVKNSNLDTEIVSILGDSGATSVKINGTRFFTATTPDTGTELWKTDATSTGASLVLDIAPGSKSSFPKDLANVDGTLYFTALNSEKTGRELWQSDGTAAGTGPVKGFVSGHRRHRRWGGKEHPPSKTSGKPPDSSNHAPDSPATADSVAKQVPAGGDSPQPQPGILFGGTAIVQVTAAIPRSDGATVADTGSVTSTILTDTATSPSLAPSLNISANADLPRIEDSGSSVTQEPVTDHRPAGPGEPNVEIPFGDSSVSSALLSDLQAAIDSDAAAGLQGNADPAVPQDGNPETGTVPEQGRGQSTADVRPKEAVVFGLSISLAPAGSAANVAIPPALDSQLEQVPDESGILSFLSGLLPAGGGDRSAGTTTSSAPHSTWLKGYNAAVSSPINRGALNGGALLMVFVPAAGIVLEHEYSTAAAGLPASVANAERSAVPATGRTLPFFLAAFDPVQNLGQEQSQDLAAGALFVQDVHSAATSSPDSWMSGNGTLWGFLFSYALVLPFGPKRHQPTIMLAEGDEATRDAMTVLLVHEGYLVLPAATAHDALGVLRAPISPIDVVLLDTHLPDVSGIHLCQRLRELYPTLPVLVCTGEAEPAEVAQLLKLGVQHYLRKPIVLHELLTTVRSLLR